MKIIEEKHLMESIRTTLQQFVLRSKFVITAREMQDQLFSFLQERMPI